VGNESAMGASPSEGVLRPIERRRLFSEAVAWEMFTAAFQAGRPEHGSNRRPIARSHPFWIHSANTSVVMVVVCGPHPI